MAMTEGTRSLLFGVHQVVWHPVCVGWAYRRYYGQWPRLWEWLCILVHDWGYWGVNYLSDAQAKADHHETGARLAEWLVGPRGRDFCENHRSASAVPSRLWVADKYSHLISPRWLKWLECFVERFHSRRVTNYMTPPLYRLLMWRFLKTRGVMVSPPLDVMRLINDETEWEIQKSGTSTYENLTRPPQEKAYEQTQAAPNPPDAPQCRGRSYATPPNLYSCRAPFTVWPGGGPFSRVTAPGLGPITKRE